ncbi:diguanylate cyclase/phosphodiesterase with CBS domain containing protein [Desulfovibrio sp. X2]|uniref:GGDEF domain-containing protein n=1 Tax=Desulfovibrio sp. X2 TaxID=941449 RepID=UPI000358CA77|nr:GGDEF domain-containing protein [Desulfovibrio sp. X2]EPR43671.1 diguanylate cyclase/phosphodiesterase with CBS domain containing protein [Desulfovibrio sp. X2]
MVMDIFQGFAATSRLRRNGRQQGELPYSFGFLSLSERNRIEEHLGQGGSLCLLLFEIKNFLVFSNLFGSDITAVILEAMSREVSTLTREYCPCAFTYVERLSEGKVMVLCARTDNPVPELQDITAGIRLKLKAGLKGTSLKLTGQTLDVAAGCALICQLGMHPLEHSLYSALCDAQHVARGELDTSTLSLLAEFREILGSSMLRVVYQPIVDFRTSEILAWEALTRGPADTYFQSPSVLFDFAEEVGQLFALEKVCREAAITKIGPVAPGQKIFLNIHPRTLVDPSFSTGETLKLLSQCGLGPSNVVFEITERHSIRDFTLFHRTLEHYRNQGFQVAVDDVGTGYSGLWTIAELRPDYIKVDMSLIREIDKNPVKRALIETFVAFAEKIGCRLIAEGIETETELRCLMGLGVHYGQGYFLHVPAFPKPVPENPLPAGRASIGETIRKELKCSIPVRELAEKAYDVPAATKVSEVKELLQGKEPISAVVVAEEGRPVGLVMSHHLDRALSTRYGMSLYFHREITRIMDASAMIVEGGEPVENVAKASMNRDKYKIYDHIVVTEAGRLAGIVSVQKILDTLAAVQVEMAKGANPLTGFPGNVAIETELERRSQAGLPFSIVYADLDNFKVYNDTYGFKDGDNVLLLLAKIMSWAVKRHGVPGEDFVGHVGGDDFVLICSQERAERICRGIVRCFGRQVRGCYCEEVRNRGSIIAKDRNGEIASFPLVSVSLAVVDCAGACTLSAIGNRAAEMKKYVKSLPGNSFARDRRGPVGDGEADCGCACA